MIYGFAAFVPVVPFNLKNSGGGVGNFHSRKYLALPNVLTQQDFLVLGSGPIRVSMQIMSLICKSCPPCNSVHAELWSGVRDLNREVSGHANLGQHHQRVKTA